MIETQRELSGSHPPNTQELWELLPWSASQDVPSVLMLFMSIKTS